jgi:predicted transcriptional regulator
VLREPGFKCNIRKCFADSFREWRRQQRLPLKQVATELGFSVATISKWERGERFPTGQNFELVVEYTGQCCASRCAPAPAKSTTAAASSKKSPRG